MARRLGFKQNVIVGAEPTYGIGETITAYPTSSTVHQDITLTYDNSIEKVETPLRNGTLEVSECETRTGRYSGTISLTGDFTEQKAEWLLRGILADNTLTDATAYVIQPKMNATTYSHVIMAYDMETTKADIYYGCVMSDLTINKDGDKWAFTANYRFKDVRRETAISVWSTSPTAVCEVPFVWSGSVFTGTLGLLTANILEYSVTLTNTFAPDDSLYGPSATKLRDLITKTTGILTAKYLYDDALDLEDLILEESYTSQVAFNSSTMLVNCKLETCAKTDDIASEFVGDLTGMLVKSTASLAFSFDYTATA